MIIWLPSSSLSCIDSDGSCYICISFFCFECDV